MRKDSMGESYRRGALKLTTCHPGPCVPVTHPVGAPEGPQGSSLRWDNNPRVLRPCFWSHSKGLFFQGLAGAELVPNVTRFSSSVLPPSPPPPAPCPRGVLWNSVRRIYPQGQWAVLDHFRSGKPLLRLESRGFFFFFLLLLLLLHFFPPFFFFSLEFIPGQTFLVCFRPISISLQT